MTKIPSVSVFFLIPLGLSACTDGRSHPLDGTPYVAVIDCVNEAGLTGSGGSFVTGKETVDEAIELISDNYNLDTRQKASIRACANTRLSATI